MSVDRLTADVRRCRPGEGNNYVVDCCCGKHIGLATTDPAFAYETARRHLRSHVAVIVDLIAGRVEIDVDCVAQPDNPDWLTMSGSEIVAHEFGSGCQMLCTVCLSGDHECCIDVDACHGGEA